MANLIVNTFPVRVNLYTGTGRTLYTTADGLYAVKISGTDITIMPLMYYSQQADIEITASLAGRGTNGLPNGYHALAVYNKIIAYIPSSATGTYRYVNRNTGIEIGSGDIAGDVMPTVTYKAFCLYRGIPSIVRARRLSTTPVDYDVQVKSMRGETIDTTVDRLQGAGISNPNFGIGIASFNKPVAGLYPFSDNDGIPQYTQFGNSIDRNYVSTNDRLEFAFGGLADVQVSALVQAWISSLENLVIGADGLISATNDGEKLFTRGIRVSLKIPPIARDTVDGQILINTGTSNAQALRYWTNGNNFGVFIHYVDIERTYLYVGHFGQDLTAATLNYNF